MNKYCVLYLLWHNIIYCFIIAEASKCLLKLWSSQHCQLHVQLIVKRASPFWYGNVGKQRRLRRDCAFSQSRQSLRCSQTHYTEQEQRAASLTLMSGSACRFEGSRTAQHLCSCSHEVAQISCFLIGNDERNLFKSGQSLRGCPGWSESSHWVQRSIYWLCRALAQSRQVL